MPFGSLSRYRVCGTERMSVRKPSQGVLEHICTCNCKKVTHSGPGWIVAIPIESCWESCEVAQT